jgi:hypothetical protein
MSYIKKEKYPSIKTPGVYRNVTDKKLGLDYDDLENLSIGNWNSLFKGNKLLLSGNLLDVIKRRSGIPVKVRTSPPKNGDRVLVWRISRNNTDIGGFYEGSGNNIYDDRIKMIQGPIFETLSDVEEVTGNNDDNQGVKKSRFERTFDVYRRFYGSENVVRNVDGDTHSIRIENNQLVSSALNFETDTGKLLEREDDDSDIRLVLDEGSKSKLNFHAFEREIDSFERERWSDADASTGKDKRFNRELVVVVNFDIQGFNIPEDTLIKLLEAQWNLDLPKEEGIVSFITYPQNSANAISLRGFGESEGNRHGYSGPNNESRDFPFSTEVFYPSLNFFNEEPYFGGFGYYHIENSFGANIGAVEFDLADNYQINFQWPNELRFSNDLTFELNGDRTSLEETTIKNVDIHFDFLNYPTFELEIAINDPEYIRGLQSFDTPVDFVVFAQTKTGTELLYYDYEDDFDDYMETSYPVNVKINIGLLGYPAHLNNTHQNIEFEDQLVAAFGGGNLAARDFLNSEVIQLPHYASSPELCYYKYQVIQWGDEKQLLTDEQINNSYFFNFYESEEYPNPGDFFYRKYQQSQEVETVSITEQLEHSYNTPGVKTIKIILYRYHPNTAFILQTYLVTTNIVVGDGVLKSQDFSIFGTSDFNFLPITDNQVIIGGFDGDSKYNNSVEQIVKDDLFSRDEFLDRVSSKDFIDKFNNQLLGENISQLDVGNTRMFNKPKDIYDFIGGARFEWITEGSGSLPLNSLATDIFIDNEDCIMDLDPSESEYSAISNNFGKAKGILIGDYKLIKTEGAPVIKQGIMESPKIDKNKDRQAF